MTYKELKQLYNDNYLVIVKYYFKGSDDPRWKSPAGYDYTAVCQDFQKRGIEGLYTPGWDKDLNYLKRLIMKSIKTDSSSTIFAPEYWDQWNKEDTKLEFHQDFKTKKELDLWIRS